MMGRRRLFLRRCNCLSALNLLINQHFLLHPSPISMISCRVELAAPYRSQATSSLFLWGWNVACEHLHLPSLRLRFFAAMFGASTAAQPFTEWAAWRSYSPRNSPPTCPQRKCNHSLQFNILPQLAWEPAWWYSCPSAGHFIKAHDKRDRRHGTEKKQA